MDNPEVSPTKGIFILESGSTLEISYVSEVAPNKDISILSQGQLQKLVVQRISSVYNIRGDKSNLT